MERNFRIGWRALVEEAKRRRKEQKLTQVQLAALAEVSTPTVSKFESGDQNIQVSSALAVLGVLGMVETRAISFPPKAAVFDAMRDVVVFAAETEQGPLSCAVSLEAIEEFVGAERGLSERAALRAFERNRRVFEQAAESSYSQDLRERDGSILIRTDRLEQLGLSANGVP